MAELPICPNHKEGSCERNEIILDLETDTFYRFHCRCCKLVWIETKPHIKGKARYENWLKKQKELRELESRGAIR